MARAHYDMTIIGGGSGGLTAARAAQALGAKVLLIDKERLGGDCLYSGCVPSKSLLHVARILQQSRENARLGFTLAPAEVDIKKVNAYVRGVIERVGKTEQSYVEGVSVRYGHVSFKSPTTLLLDGEEVTSRSTLIATGSHPALPTIAGLAETGYLTNEDVFDLNALPSSLLIAGGGPVGVEMAQAFTRLGTNVTLIQGPERILPREDPQVSATIAEILQAEGVTIITNARLIKAQKQGKKKGITVQQAGQDLSFEAEELLLALGRRANVEGLDLVAAGVDYNEQGIKVDAYLQTSRSNILAIGDVIGGYLFTHVAAYQAGIAVRNALFPIGKKKVDYRVVPWCTFTDPEAARVGLTPAEAKERHKQTRIVTFPWTTIDRAQTESETTGFIKLVLAGKKDTIVGAHMVGVHAGELLGEIAMAMQHHLTLNDIFNTIHTYPTMSTGLQQAAYEAYLTSASAASNRRIVRTLLRLRR
ncbi:MAG TPA: NAD(P)/FAD-dependent oxidoreductase [Ktedonobacteraceae bacterium]|nr:NAD(P)/FAD-dependent oxidoreductase [Ktedonobacteraceae bacterium]